MTDNYRAALDVLVQTGAGQNARRNRAAEVAPDFVRLALGFSYGDILARPGLDLKLRALALVAAHAALPASDELHAHVAAALHLGWSKAELIELLVQSAIHAGIPAALRSLADCHDLLVDRNSCHSGCEASVSCDGQL